MAKTFRFTTLDSRSQEAELEAHRLSTGLYKEKIEHGDQQAVLPPHDPLILRNVAVVNKGYPAERWIVRFQIGRKMRIVGQFDNKWIACLYADIFRWRCWEWLSDEAVDSRSLPPDDVMNFKTDNVIRAVQNYSFWERLDNQVLGIRSALVRSGIWLSNCELREQKSKNPHRESSSLSRVTRLGLRKKIVGLVDRLKKFSAIPGDNYRLIEASLSLDLIAARTELALLVGESDYPSKINTPGWSDVPETLDEQKAKK